MRVIPADADAWNTTMAGQAGALTLELPVQTPGVLVPVIEIFLQD